MADVELSASIAATSSVLGTLSGVTIEMSVAIATASGLSSFLSVPEKPAFVRGIRMIAPGGRHPIRRIPFDWIRKGIAYTETVQVAAEIALTGPRLWTDRTGWMRISIDGGGFQAVGNSWTTGVDLGAFTEGQRKTVVVEITVPPATEIRSDFLPVNLGIGIDH